jgi:hypothetical protein
MIIFIIVTLNKSLKTIFKVHKLLEIPSLLWIQFNLIHKIKNTHLGQAV